MTLVYKVLSQQDWDMAERAGVFHGASIDLKDGYIHLSSGEQLGQTVTLHFADRDELVLVALEAARLGEDLKWEPSRGGALFPHFYGILPIEIVAWTRRFSSRDLEALRRLITESR